MSSPARDARLLSIARGFTQVLSRGDSHIVTRNPINGKCAYDGQVGGGWHYNGDQETDTAWVTGVAPWNYQITKANYNLFALSQLNQGQLLKCLDPASGQSITFQPMALQWTNALNQIQQISMPRSVAAQVSDDVLYWPSGYGSGRHFKYVASPSRLNKLLIIDSAANLPACPAYITNPWLELTFTLTPSTGVVMYVDGVAWDHATTKTTANAIEFKLPSGQVVWQLAAPMAYDSSDVGDPCTGQIKLYVNKKVKYASVRFPKAWIDAAIFPIVLDPTVDYSVGASADDGLWQSATTSFVNNGANVVLGKSTILYNSFLRFSAVAVPPGATIDTSYITMVYKAKTGTPVDCDLYFEDADNPSAVSGYTDGDNRVKTTATIKVKAVESAGNPWNTNSLNSIIQEVIDRAGWTSGNAMQCLIYPPSGLGNFNYSLNASWDDTTYDPPALHIEYTEASTSSWAGTWGG